MSVAGLHLGQSIHASEVKLPEGATMVTAGSVVVVQVAQPTVVGEETAATAAEPELIRKEKATDEDKK